MTYDHNVLMVPHGWSTAVGLAADLQLSAALPVARYVEYLTPCVYLDELITQPFYPDAEGYLTIPEKPGLGIELNREALTRFGVCQSGSQQDGIHCLALGACRGNVIGIPVILLSRRTATRCCS